MKDYEIKTLTSTGARQRETMIPAFRFMISFDLF